MDPLKIAHLSYAADATDGGISTALSDLIAAQYEFGLLPEWHTSSLLPSFSRDFALSSAITTGNFQLAHLHGLWRSHTRIASRLAASGLPLIIAPHGMLSPTAWAISRRKKELIWHLWERRALESACCVHALSSAEAVAVRQMLPRMPIATIPNGVIIPDIPADFAHSSPPWAGSIPIDESVLLFFGRFHPIKGIEPLLSAWQAVASAAKEHGFWLAFVGYGDHGALSQRVSQAQADGQLERVRVLGPMFGEQKFAALSSAAAFVLPSFSEALPMGALEAMAYQCPSLLSAACNLPEAFRVGAAIQAEPEHATLANSLLTLFNLSEEERCRMGKAGHAFVRDHFSSSQVAAKTHELYSWILEGGVRPSFVDLA